MGLLNDDSFDVFRERLIYMDDEEIEKLKHCILDEQIKRVKNKLNWVENKLKELEQ